MRMSREGIVPLLSSNSMVNLIFVWKLLGSAETELPCRFLPSVKQIEGQAVFIKNPFFFKMAQKDIGQNRT